MDKPKGKEGERKGGPPAAEAAPPPAGEPAPEPEAPACAEVDLASLTPEGLKDLLKKAREREEFLDRLRCLTADAENYRKRLQRESSRHRLWGIRDLAREFLAPLDNLERALKAAAEPSTPRDSLREGVRMAVEQFREALRRLGVKPVEAVGKSFDPGVHEAIAEVPAAGAAPGTVVEELERGYVLEDLVVRPSRVVVAKAAAAPAPPGGGAAGTA